MCNINVCARQVEEYSHHHRQPNLVRWLPFEYPLSNLKRLIAELTLPLRIRGLELQFSFGFKAYRMCKFPYDVFLHKNIALI